MDVSEECNGGVDPTDDLRSFELVDLSNPALLDLSDDLSDDVSGPVHESKEKTKLRTKLVSAWNNVKYGGRLRFCTFEMKNSKSQ